MAVVTDEQKYIGMDIKGKLGSQGDLDPTNVLGIYQVRTRFGHRTNVKEKFYTPTNPNSTLQQFWRLQFANSIIAWRNLSAEKKKMYNKRAQGRQMSGYNLFQKQYLLAKTP